MSNFVELRFKRGNTAQNDAYIGAEGELSLDQEQNQVRIHDGVTPGGRPHITGFNEESVGRMHLVSKDMDTPGYLPMDGTLYLKSEYPELAEHFPVGVFNANGERKDIPMLPEFIANPSFSPDGTMVAFCGRDINYGADANALYVYRTSNWERVTLPTPISDSGRGLTWSPDGKHLVLLSESAPFLYVLKTSDWSIVQGPSLPSMAGYLPTFSKDGQRLAVPLRQSDGKILTLLETANWTEVGSYTDPEGNRPSPIEAVFSPDEQQLVVTCSRAPFFYALDAANLMPNGFLGEKTTQIVGFSYSPDGSKVALGEGDEIAVYDVQSEVELLRKRLPGRANGIDFTPDGQYLIYFTAKESYVGVLSTSDWQFQGHVFNDIVRETSGAISPDSQTLIILKPSSASADNSNVVSQNSFSVIERSVSAELYLPDLRDSQTENRNQEWRVKAS